ICAESRDPTGDVHLDDDENKSVAYASDFAVFKQKADVTLTGHAHAPRGSGPASQVSFFFGGKKQGFKRNVAVLGDRYWDSLAQTAPKSFTKLPLVYERAFGGARFDRNP